MIFYTKSVDDLINFQQISIDIMPPFSTYAL